MQAAATPRAPSPASATQAFTADGDANATTSAPRAAASASAGSAATGSVLYVLRRTTSAPRAARPACRVQCPTPQQPGRPPHAACSTQSCMAPCGGAPRRGALRVKARQRPALDRQARHEVGAECAQGGPAGRIRPWRRPSRARVAPGRPPSAAAPRPGAPHWPAHGGAHVSACLRGSRHGVRGARQRTAWQASGAHTRARGSAPAPGCVLEAPLWQHLW